MNIILLADVIASREEKQRDDYLANIAEASKRFNQRYKGLPGKAERYNGDQLGVVFAVKHWPICFAAAMDLSHWLRPHQLRITLASGEIDAGLETRLPSKMDGPGFHRAAKNLQTQGDRLFHFAHAEPLLDGVISTLGNTALTLLARSSSAEHDALLAVEKHGSHTAAAEALGISRQAVSKALKRADYGLITELRQRVDELLLSLAPGEDED